MQNRRHELDINTKAGQIAQGIREGSPEKVQLCSKLSSPDDEGVPGRGGGEGPRNGQIFRCRQ